jgi:hypothetical protein
VGDAVSDLLVVEAILHSKGWDAVEWESMYSDLPNRQLKVSVANRNNITTTDAERKCVSPEGLQDQIDSIVVKYPNGRSFVRYVIGFRKIKVVSRLANMTDYVYSLNLLCAGPPGLKMSSGFTPNPTPSRMRMI